MDTFNSEDTLDAVWVTDSETSKRYLLDLKTSKIIMTGEDLENRDA